MQNPSDAHEHIPRRSRPRRSVFTLYAKRGVISGARAGLWSQERGEVVKQALFVWEGFVCLWQSMADFFFFFYGGEPVCALPILPLLPW